MNICSANDVVSMYCNARKFMLRRIIFRRTGFRTVFEELFYQIFAMSKNCIFEELLSKNDLLHILEDLLCHLQHLVVTGGIHVGTQALLTRKIISLLDSMIYFQ